MKTMFLAGALDDYPLPGIGPVSPVMRERLLVLGAIVLVAGIILAWAYFSRQKRRQSVRREERRHRRRSFARNASKSVAEIKNFVKEKQKGRRRQHRPRNPTLAETGGLPPVRKDTPPAPTSPA